MNKVNDEGAALELVKASMRQPQQAAPDFLLRKVAEKQESQKQENKK